MIEIEIDGKKLSAQPGAMIIQLADEHGIYIPRFCYHKKLSIAANCRMCLVEVEKAPKTLPACATPVADGMKIFTQSEKTLQSQKAVMEFLLINHPLDCPICDQGGECELQDLAMGYGKGISRYQAGKRSVKDKNLGPLIASEMTRCIQCTRCVRFGDEVAGMPELGATGRGELLEITTYIQHAIKSEISGNMIDVCPVGALTNKPYRFTARAWEMQQHEAIAPHDCLGSNVYIHTRGEEYSPMRHVMRVVPRENEEINETWLSDRDRYSYEAIHSSERLLNPLIKRDGQWQTVDLETALHEIKARLSEVIRKTGGESIGALVSPNATLEEGYLLQKWLRGIGIYNIDHRIRQADFRDQEAMPLYPTCDFAISELQQLDSLLLVGSDVRHEQPLANQRIRKAVVKNNATVFCINPIDYDTNFKVAGKQIVGGAQFVLTLAKILKSLCNKLENPSLLKGEMNQLGTELASFIASIQPGDAEDKIAHTLLAGKNSAVILGAYATAHPQSAVIRVLLENIAKLSDSRFGTFTEGANTQGMWLAGVVPHRGPVNQKTVSEGLHASAMLEEKLRAYILFNVEADLDFAFSEAAVQALSRADLVVAVLPFKNSCYEQYAHIMLPMATFAETPATYVNVEGKWQSMKAATLPMEGVYPGWEIIHKLGNLFELKGFVYASASEVSNELKMIIETEKINPPASATQSLSPSAFTESVLKDQYPVLTRLGSWPMYRVDSIVRRAEALQATLSMDVFMIRMNNRLAEQLKLQGGTLVTAVQGQNSVSLPLLIDDRIADNHVLIPSGLQETAGFGEAFGEIVEIT